MSVVARLKFLEAIKIVNSPGSPGRDIITLRADPDMGMFRNASYGMQPGDTLSFDIFPDMQDLHLAAQVKLLLYHYDDFQGRQYILGTEFIVADEVGLGERRKQFTGQDAHYGLTYDVVEVDG